MRQLTPRIYGILTMGSFLNGYLIRHEKSLTLVDAGIPGFASSVEKALTNIGATWNDLTHIFITHAHPDHVGDLAGVQAKSNAQTLTHRLEAPTARGEMAVVKPDPKTLSPIWAMMNRAMGSGLSKPARVDRALNGDETLDEIAPGAQVIHLPGHAPGQLGLWLPDEGSLIAGDMIFNYPLGGLRMPLRPATVDWEEAKRSIKKAAQMDVKNLMMGHGKPLLGDAKGKLSAFAATLSSPEIPNV